MSAALSRVIVIALALAACGSHARPGIPPRNCVIVTICGLRADHTGPYLYERATTALPSDPTAREEGRAMGLDDLAAAGVVFARCYAPSPRCVPSLGSLFSGLSPLECGVTTDDDGVPEDVATLPELFAHAGFQTAAFVTTTSLDLQGAFGRGFATFHTSTDDTATLAAATEWAKQDQGDGARRFLWIHLRGPEAVFSGAPPSDGRPEVEELLAQRSFGPEESAADLARFAAGDAAPDSAQRAALSATYDREIARASIALSLMLRDAFDYYQTNADASETWSRTVFTLTSPCGALLGENGVVGHAGTLHDAALHVPLVIRHPDSLTGERVVGDVVELEDVLPTFVEWFDLARPRRMRGRSLLTLVDRVPAAPFERRPAITALPERIFSARDERFHMVWNPLHDVPADGKKSARVIPELALYEPDRDPLETVDVADLHPDVVRAFEEAIRVWRDHQEPYPLEKRRPGHGIVGR
jgi:arylsulfatase A-like enzyme